MARDENDITLTDVVKVAGMGTAIGLGVRKWWQLTNFNEIVQGHRIPGNYERAYQATQSALADMGGMSTGRANRYNQVGLDALIRGVKNEKLFLTSTDILSALERAAIRQDPSGTLITQIQMRIEAGMSPAQALEHVQDMSRQSSSIYLHRTISSFLADVETMEERLAAGKSITPTALPDMLIGKSTPIKLQQLAHRGGLVETIQKIEEELQGRVVLRGYKRGDIPGQQLQLRVFGSPFMEPSKKGVPQLSVNIPLSLENDPGIVFHGATQQSKYVTGEFWLLDKLKDEWRLKKKVKYEEWAVRRFLEKYVYDIVNANRVARRDVHSIEHTFHQDILKPLEWVDELPEGYHAGQDAYIKARTQTARLSFLGGGRDLTDIEYADVIRKGVVDEAEYDLFNRMKKVYPAASPVSMTRNVVSLVDWRELGIVPEAFDWARRPAQALRREFTPTGVATGKIQRHELSQLYSWAARDVGAPSPMLRTLYVKSELAPQLQRLGMNIEGSGFMAQSVAPMFAQNELARYTVSSQGMLDLKDILGRSKKGVWDFEGKVIPAGTVLGYDPEGLPVTVEEDFKLFRAARFQDKNRKDFIRLVGSRTLEDMDWFKVFGDAKAMMGVVEQRRINRTLGLTGQQLDLPIHAIVTMDELRKNRSLHYKQMFTSLFEFTRENMLNRKGGDIVTSSLLGQPSKRWAAGAPWPKIAQEFYADPEAAINQLRRTAVKGDKLSHDVLLSGIRNIARAAELTPSQMGGVFGAVPEVFGEGWQSMFSAAEAEAIMRGTPVGMAQFAFGGRYGPGSGKMGTIEPRMFELLSSSHLGSLGPELQEEVVRRMTHRYGYRLGEQEILGKSALALLEQKGKAGVLPSLWTEEMTQAGGLLNIPDLGDVPIPSHQQLSQLATYTTAGGIDVTPQLASEYETLISQARKYEIGEISKSDMLESMNTARQEIMRGQMLTITGNDALARGRLMGSRFLTSVPPVYSTLQRGEVGITRSMAERMLSEVAEVHGDRELKKTLMAQLEAGEAIGGLMMRHPFIGPHSSAAVAVRMVQGDRNTIQVGEEFFRASMEGKDIGNIRLGPAVGMAMDYDADIANLMLLPEATGRKALSVAATEEADAYAVRSQLLKAKKAAVKGVTLSEAAAGAVLKHRIPKERLGLISESLQVARAAVLSNANKLERQRAMNALGFLEWLEQTPIAAKHIAAGEEKQMISLFSNIREAIGSRNREKLAASALSVVGIGGLGERFLGTGGRVVLEGGGGTRAIDVQGIGLQQATEDIMGSIGEFERKGVAGISPARLRQVIRGRGAKISAEEARALFSFGFEGESAFSGLLKQVAEPSTMGKVSRAYTAARNKVASFGGRILEHAKPMALGFGAAVGIATLLSGPPRTMKMNAPPTVKPSRGGTGGENITPQDISSPELHRAQMGNPTVDQPLAGPQSTPIMPNSTRIKVRGKSQGGVDYNMLNSNLSRALGGAQVSSKVLDNRKSLDAQTLSKLMEENY